MSKKTGVLVYGFVWSWTVISRGRVMWSKVQLASCISLLNIFQLWFQLTKFAFVCLYNMNKKLHQREPSFASAYTCSSEELFYILSRVKTMLHVLLIYHKACVFTLPFKCMRNFYFFFCDVFREFLVIYNFVSDMAKRKWKEKKSTVWISLYK